jgi:hypothetical protein
MVVVVAAGAHGEPKRLFVALDFQTQPAPIIDTKVSVIHEETSRMIVD